MTLDNDVACLLSELNAAIPTISADSSPSTLRTQFNQLVSLMRPSESLIFEGSITNESLGGVPVRSYRPARGNEDVIVHMHGGGWVLGNLDSAHPTALAIASQTGCTVISVDYRLAPKSPFPAALDDCCEVVERVRSHRRPRWVGVCGDSAGGNLAAATAATCDGINGQLLFYPALDPRMNSQSHAEMADGYLLTGSAMRYYWQAYGDSSSVDPRYAPIFIVPSSQTPPAVVTTAEHDPLRDEGCEFANRLTAAGVEVDYLPLPGLIHGWLDLTERVPAAAAARDQVIAAFDRIRTAAL